MRNTEEIIKKYAVDANLFRLGSTNSKIKICSRWIYNYLDTYFYNFFFMYIHKFYLGA